MKSRKIIRLLQCFIVHRAISFILTASSLGAGIGVVCVHHYLQHLVQCLAHSMCSINNCWMNKQNEQACELHEAWEMISLLSWRNWSSECSCIFWITEFMLAPIWPLFVWQASSPVPHFHTQRKAVSSSHWSQEGAVFWKQNKGPGLPDPVTINCEL